MSFRKQSVADEASRKDNLRKRSETAVCHNLRRERQSYVAGVTLKWDDLRMLELIWTAARGAEPLLDLHAWRVRHDTCTATLASPVSRALVGGAWMDRIGYAFATGYRTALEALIPSLHGPAVLAATELGGGHPRAIHTRLGREPDGRWRLDGQKTWCTLGPHAERLLVVARTGEDAAGRPVLKVVQVPPDAPGVRVTALPELPFVPEIPHASLGLEGVVVDAADILPGDGYADYLKPFRTVEDVHVFAALTGHTLARLLARSGPAALIERGLALSAALLTLGQQSPSASSTHLALTAALEDGRALLHAAGTYVEEPGSLAAQRWARDLPLLDVAGKARRARAEAARAAVGAGLST